MVNDESKTFKPLDKNIKKTRVVYQHQKREIKQASKKKKKIPQIHKHRKTK